MRLLFIYSCLYVASATNVVLQYSLTNNNISLRCIDPANGDNINAAMIEFLMTPESSSPHMIKSAIGNGGVSFQVTPLNEAYVRCRANGEQSELVAFAAVPQSYEGVEMTIPVFNNEEVTLTCPIQLGNLHQRLMPYELSWDVRINDNLPEQVENPNDEGRKLRVNVNNATSSNQYSCKLRLRRCCELQEMDCGRCDIMVYDGPIMRFEVFEMSRRVFSPVAKTVSKGQNVTFFCEGYGSSVNISWVYTTLCENCGTMESNTTNLTVSSTLTIDTSQLAVGDFTLTCVIHQNVSVRSVMDKVFSAPLIIIDPEPSPDPPTSSTSSSTPAPTPITSTETTTLPNPSSHTTTIIVSTTVALIIALAVVFGIVLFVIWKHRSNKGEYSVPQDSPGSVPVQQPWKLDHSNRVYEELPESVFITAGEPNYYSPQHPLSRQNGIEYDQSNPKASSLLFNQKPDNISYHGSDDRHSRSGGGSDMSGLSGVSGNIPGAHKMPTYSQDTSVVSEPFLAPPHTWDIKRYSDSTVNTRHTQSTYLPPTHPPEQAVCHRSATEVHNNNPALFRPYYLSHDNVNFNVSESHRAVPQSYTDGPPLFPARVSHSVVSSSRHSSSQSHLSQHVISDKTLLSVMNCLMHNRDCEILDCPCRIVQERYRHLEASRVPLQQKKSPERKHRKPSALAYYSSESDSDVPDTNSRRARNMRLKLNDEKKLHPHYHITTKSHVCKSKMTSSAAENHRRSRSMSDLTPITETRETPTPCPQVPLVGGAIKAGTPVHCERMLGEAESTFIGPTKEELLRQKAPSPLPKKSPPLLREISLSSDNLPVLCLNNCPLQLKTPSPMKSHTRNISNEKRVSNKPVLQPLREISNGTETDDSNTSSRSGSSENEAIKSSHSENDEGVEESLVSQNTHPINHLVGRGESSGYDSEPYSANILPTHIHGHVSPSLRRSSSPFETATTVSSDGTVIKTTEC